MNAKSSVLAVLAAAAMTAAAHAAVGDLFAITGSAGAPSSLWRVDKTSGAASLVGPTGLNHFTGIDFDPTTGILYGHRNNGGPGELYTISTSTGAASFVGSTSVQSPDITFDNSGRLFAWTEFGTGTFVFDDMVELSKFSGAKTELGDSGTSTARTGLFTALDGTLYMKSQNSLYTVNPGSGAVSFYGSISGAPLANPTDVDPTDGRVYAGERGFGGGSTLGLHYFDLSGLSTTSVGVIYDVSSGGAISNISGLAFEVPAPGSLALLGLGGLAAARRRRA